MNNFNDFSLDSPAFMEFLKSHHNIIKREIEISCIEIKSAPIGMKNFFLEKHNLFKGLDLLIERNKSIK